jgi:deazaflavin-dependent oxidoreductase (nitroreductase family)
MPMPLWWGHVNKRVFNPRSLRNGRWSVIHHTGRSSGRQYRTPVEAIRIDDDIIVMLVYGSRSDWVQNVLAAGRADVEMSGETVAVVNPEVIDTAAATPRLPTGTKLPPKFLHVDECLLMHCSETA